MFFLFKITTISFHGCKRLLYHAWRSNTLFMWIPLTAIWPLLSFWSAYASARQTALDKIHFHFWCKKQHWAIDIHRVLKTRKSLSQEHFKYNICTQYITAIWHQSVSPSVRLSAAPSGAYASVAKQQEDVVLALTTLLSRQVASGINMILKPSSSIDFLNQ